MNNVNLRIDIYSQIKGYFKDWSMYEKIWLLSFTIIILGLSMYWGDGIIGILASLTGIWCVVLVAKGKISNYYFGIANVLLYAYVAYGWKYYGEVMLNILYFFPMQFIGLYMWTRNKNKKKNDEVKAKLMTNKQRFGWGIITLAGIFAYGTFLSFIGGSMAYTDSATTVMSVIAMILMALRFTEQWVLWILVDIFSIVLWVSALMSGGTDIAVLVMWIAYLVNAIYGLINWIKLS